MRIAGGILVILGLLLCLTIFGAFFGIPMIIVGLVLLVAGGRRKTVITNVVQVSNTTAGPQFSMGSEDSGWQRPEPREQRRPPPAVRGEAAPQLPYRQAVPDLELEFEDDRFVDVRRELTERSKRILGFAKQDGYDLKARADRITIRKGDHEEVFESNGAIADFGRAMGYH
jgi:hypothetical protein